MNVVEIANAGLAGFLISLLVLDIIRPLVGEHWPLQVEGFRLERRLLPWLIAIVAGPAVLWDRSRSYRSGQAGSFSDAVLLMMLVAVWSASYGFSLGWLVETLIS